MNNLIKKLLDLIQFVRVNEPEIMKLVGRVPAVALAILAFAHAQVPIIKDIDALKERVEKLLK